MGKTGLAKLLVITLALPALLLPAATLIYIVFRGAPALDWTFLTTTGEGVGFGNSSGILAQILGSLLLAVAASLLAAPIAFGAALYYCLLAGPRQRHLLITLLNMLHGVPPIVFGLCGLIVCVHLLQWGVSLLTGAVTLAAVILPLLVLNTVAALERIAIEQTEAAQALGLSHATLIWRVWLPQAWPGIVTGQLLAMARVLSETAPILFTATVFSGVVWPGSIFEPVTTLQTHIFYLAQEGNNVQATQVAWGSALVLIVMVAIFGVLARWLRTWRVTV